MGVNVESHERVARAVIACLEDGLEPYGVKTHGHGFELSVGQGNLRRAWRVKGPA